MSELTVYSLHDKLVICNYSEHVKHQDYKKIKPLIKPHLYECM